MTYKCFYCEKSITTSVTCPGCATLITMVRKSPKTFFNILSVLADEIGLTLYLTNGYLYAPSHFGWPE